MSSFIPLGGAIALLLLAVIVRAPGIGSLNKPTSHPKKTESKQA